MTVFECLDFFAAAYGMGLSEREQTVRDVLALTDMTARQHDLVRGLSRGMQQRVSLARCLVHDPELLLLDEPASGLDPRARIEIRELLKELRSMGKTVLVSSHILHELAQMCTRIGIIEAGHMVAEGSLNDIYRQLSLHRAVHVQLANQTDELVDKIKRIPGVQGVERDIDRISVRIREEELPCEDLLERLVALGARVRMFQPEAMDMETAFMKLTEGKVA
jgi:ABC-2 type transport system ATP-binding protein